MTLLNVQPRTAKTHGEPHSNMYSEAGGDAVWLLLELVSARISARVNGKCPLTESEAYALISELLDEIKVLHDEVRDSDVLHFIEYELEDDWKDAFGTAIDDWNF